MLRLLILCGLVGALAAQHHQNCHQSCPHHATPVCGTDGHTYTTLCALKNAVCQYTSKHPSSPGKLAFAHNGRCVSTNTQHPCDIVCNEEEDPEPVCGSNSVTYGSICELNNAVCNASKQGHHITYVHKGACLTLHGDCSLATAPCPKTAGYVCGTNGYTYLNKCYLRQADCRLGLSLGGQPIEYLHDGRCQMNSTNYSRSVDCSKYVDGSLSGLAVEGSNIMVHNCPTTHNAVCATNGITFHNECTLCQRMAIHHKLTASTLTVPIVKDGLCDIKPIIG